MRASVGIRLLLLSTLLEAGALLQPAAPAAASPPAAALVLFLDAESDAALPAPPAALREATRQALVAALAAPGRRLCAGDEVEALLIQARVRSPRSLSRALVTALGERCGAEQVLVARLAWGRGKLFLTLRALAPADGSLLQVAVVERELSLGEDWHRAIGDAALRLAADWGEPAAPPPAAPGLLVLPVRGPGVDPLLLSLVEERLLADLLAARRWRLPEPALALSALREVGRHPGSLGAAGRRELAATFAVDALLRLSLSEYGDAGSGAVSGGSRGSAFTAPREQAFDEETLAEAVAGAAPAAALPAARQAARPLYAALELVDAESGLLRLVSDCYLPAVRLTRSFGRPRALPWEGRCAELTAPLVETLIAGAAGGKAEP